MADNVEDDYSDLRELGIDVDGDGDPLSQKFDKCVKHVQSIAGTLQNDVLLTLYGYYKQSIEGPCTTSKPSWYDMKGKAKWEAWKALGDLGKDEAKTKYIDTVLSICPDFSFDKDADGTNRWIQVSSHAREPVPHDQNICDHIRSGSIEKVTEYLKENELNELDESGLGLIHYAADIGNIDIIGVLIQRGCDVNLQDSDGQTALHYAASCGHTDCVGFLLEKNARCDIRDNDGCIAKEVACDEDMQALFA